MTPKLTTEQLQALQQARGEPVPVEDENSDKVYVIVDRQTHEQAMKALRQQEDCAAIQRGIEDMEAGRGMPVEEADKHLRERLGFPPRSDR